MSEELRRRCREMGARRLAFAEAVSKGDEKQDDWPDPEHAFAMRFGSCWTAAPIYAVPDFEAEIGFWGEVLGFSFNALMADYAMVTPPGREFFFSMVPANEERPAVRGLQIDFMVQDIEELIGTLKERGVVLTREQWAPFGEENPMRCAMFDTPGGVPVQLWCFPGA